jgi:membrane-associated HD superfamily phosphohydrolase
MIGSERQRAIQEWQARQQTEEQARVRAQTEEEMLKFGEENADYLRQNYPKAFEHINNLQAQRAQREVQEAHQRAITAVAESLGRSLNDLPEWAERTDEDVQKLAAALANKPPEEVIPAFNRFVVDFLADKREGKRRQKWQEGQLSKEREAIRQEEAARLLKGSTAPDTTKPKGEATFSPTTMSDAEFNDYWKKKYGR